MYKYILFDLDGTLTDSMPGITNSVMYALSRFGIKVADRSELYSYIGPPLLYGFQTFHGMSPEDAEKAVAVYREYFADRGLFENEVYEGVPEMLKTLKDAGAELIIATSKPEEFTNRILDHFDLRKFFTLVCGNTLAESRPKKEDVIAYIRQLLPDLDGSNAIMVGDREYDVTGAHINGIKTVGVLYGYGSREEMETAGADYIAPTVGELTNLLQSI